MEPDGITPLAEAPAGEPQGAAETPAALKLQPQIAELMKKAGIDPATAKPQEVVDYLQQGNMDIYAGLQKTREAKKALEAEVQGYRALELQKIFGDAGIGESGKAVLSDLQSKAAKSAGFIEILSLAKDEGLIPEQLFDAVLTASTDAARPVISLLKQLGLQAAGTAAERKTGVGSDISTAGQAVPATEHPMSIDTKDLLAQLKQKRDARA